MGNARINMICCNYVHCFILGIIYLKRNKSKSNKNVIASSSNSVSGHDMNMDDDYKEAFNK
jgi:hypothetical protein